MGQSHRDGSRSPARGRTRHADGADERAGGVSWDPAERRSPLLDVDWHSKSWSARRSSGGRQAAPTGVEVGMAVSEDRRLAVLRAIVEDYVQTREPVGSKALVERHSLGVSPATIRNDMAALEEEGLHHPAAHERRAGSRRTRATACSSTGCRRSSRCPRPRGGRSQALLDGAVDLDDVVDRTVRLLAQLTRQVAVVQYPSLTRSTVRHIELVPLGGARTARRADHQHRPGRAAGRRGRGAIPARRSWASCGRGSTP